MMRLTIFSVTLSMMATASCVQLQQYYHRQQQQPQHQREQQQQQQPYSPEEQELEKQQLHQQPHYHNLSIMQNVTDSELPVPLQHAIAACCSIIRDYFAPHTNSFILSSNIQGVRLHFHMRDFLNKVLLCLNMIKVEIENVHGDRETSFNRKYNLIVVDSAESLRLLDPGSLSRDYDIQEYYLLYLMHASRFSDVQSVLLDMFAYFWQNYIINVSIIMVNVETDSVDAYTYYPFHDSLSCKLVSMKNINNFAGSWAKPVEFYMFPEKLWNLQRCPLNVAVWDTPPYLSYHLNEHGFYDIGYFEAELLLVLADKLNFSLELKEPPNNEQRGKVLKNGTTTGALKMLQERIADFSLGSFRYTLGRSELLTAALPYYQTWQIYGFLKTGQPYSSLEILVYAFDDKTWLCLILSIQLVLIVAYIIQFHYNKSLLVRIIMGYPRPTTPLINIIKTFMGQTVTRLPQTNFTRFVVICWDIYGVLMRTAYQSLLFQLLKGNLYHQPPQSLTDLIRDGCKLVTTELTFDSVSTVPRIEQGLIDVIKIQNTSEQSTYFYVEDNKDGICLAGISPMDFLTYHATKEKKRGIFLALPEKIFTQHITMYFSKHSFLINRFNLLFMNLRSMGLIDFWASKSLDASYFHGSNEAHFKPISYQNVKGIFIIYVALIFVTAIIFCLEMAVFKFKQILYGPSVKFVK